MASIASLDVTIFRGYMPRARRRFRIRPGNGVNGDGVVFGAYHVGPVSITTRIKVPESQASGQVAAYTALQEQYITVVDQFGDPYENTLVCDVVCERPVVIGGEAEITAVWTFLPETIPPTGAT